MNIHVTPISDLMVHHESISCPCNPKVDGKLVIHNAFDGRDIEEALATYSSTDSVSISRSEHEALKLDAERYKKLKSLALTAQTSKTFAISKYEGDFWAAYELSPIDLDAELDAIDTSRKSS